MKNGFTFSCKTHSSENSTFPSQGALFPLRSSVGSLRAFTLAEVLLTLAIIGVVAALTIPAVITKVTQDQYVVGLKKAYNTLKAVQREAEQEHGAMENWDWTLNSKDSFEKYFKPHFDILKDCGASTDDGCFHGANELKHLNGDNDQNNFNDPGRYNFITSDGVAYSYYIELLNPPLGHTGYFAVDVNGKKGPNILGRDIFSFDVFRKAGIKPVGSLVATDETQTVPSSDVNNHASVGCNTSAQGNYCPAKVLAEGSMNY